MKPYLLESGQGWTFNYGIPHTVKLGEVRHGRGAAVFEYTTRKGEEPPDHTHATEDELFYVLEGEVEFHCQAERFHAKPGSFVFLPKGIQHGYDILSDGDVRLLVVTYPVQESAGKGWGGYLADVETQGEPVAIANDAC
jgi:quercetin dioxygenase-like cupin family protein